MNEKRKASQFAVYRLTQTGSRAFLSNHNTEEAAKHAAACLQACAPDHVSYIVDPPHGPLSSDEPSGLAAVLTRLFSRT